MCYNRAMIITYHGVAFCKISQGDVTLALNPIGKSGSRNVAKSGADIAVLCRNEPDYNGAETVTLGTKKPIVFSDAGEYEVGGIFIKGYDSLGQSGKNNVIYSIVWDEINLCHLGALANPEINPDILESLGDIDILFLPINEKRALSAKDACKLAKRLDSKIIIPVHYDGAGKDELVAFLKETGSPKREILEKLTIKRKDLENKNGEVITVESF